MATCVRRGRRHREEVGGDSGSGSGGVGDEGGGGGMERKDAITHIATSWIPNALWSPFSQFFHPILHLRYAWTET